MQIFQDQLSGWGLSHGAGSLPPLPTPHVCTALSALRILWATLTSYHPPKNPSREAGQRELRSSDEGMEPRKGRVVPQDPTMVSRAGWGLPPMPEAPILSGPVGLPCERAPLPCTLLLHHTCPGLAGMPRAEHEVPGRAELRLGVGRARGCQGLVAVGGHAQWAPCPALEWGFCS